MSRTIPPTNPANSPANANPKQIKRSRKNRKVLVDAKVVPERGSLRKSEKLTIDQLIQSNSDVIAPSQVEAIAIAMRREPATIEKYITAARERFLSNADRYAAIHAEAAERGLALGDAKGLEVSRKAAEFGMSNASNKDFRVIDSPGQSSNAPVIKIGIALGGLPSKTHDDHE
jgi:hypothetical protein